VEFIWVEEEAVDLRAGSAVMFLSALIASLIFLIQLCGLDSEDDGNATRQDDYKSSSRMTTSVGYASDSAWGHRE
jgi:hypothetical protein